MATVSTSLVQEIVDKCSPINTAHLQLQNSLKHLKTTRRQEDVDDFYSKLQNLQQAVNSFETSKTVKQKSVSENAPSKSEKTTASTSKRKLTLDETATSSKRQRNLSGSLTLNELKESLNLRLQ